MFARQQAITKRITIEFEVRNALPPVEHDPAQINQVLLNLLLNAIQSMDKPGVIRVTLQQNDDDTVRITVSDQGKGIAPEHLPNIFRPFFTTKGHGTGLGLSLARRIVESHGGSHSRREYARRRHAVRRRTADSQSCRASLLADLPGNPKNESPTAGNHHHRRGNHRHQSRRPRGLPSRRRHTRRPIHRSGSCPSGWNPCCATPPSCRRPTC